MQGAQVVLDTCVAVADGLNKRCNAGTSLSAEETLEEVLEKDKMWCVFMRRA